MNEGLRQFFQFRLEVGSHFQHGWIKSRDRRREILCHMTELFQQHPERCIVLVGDGCRLCPAGRAQLAVQFKNPIENDGRDMGTGHLPAAAAGKVQAFGGVRKGQHAAGWILAVLPFNIRFEKRVMCVFYTGMDGTGGYMVVPDSFVTAEENSTFKL